MLEWIVGTAGYLGVSAGVAKGQFNYLRNHEIESDYRDNLRYNDPEKALKRAKESADRYADINIIPALFMGILWPVAAPLVFGTRGLQKWFMKNPGKSKAELEVEHLVMAKRIKELEKELGING